MDDKVAYDDVKQFISDAIVARSRDEIPDYLKPSKYWLDFCKFSAYVRRLDNQELGHIRNHTWHLTGDSYQSYYFGSPVENRCLAEEYEYLVGRLGIELRMGEDERGIGFDTRWGKLNRDRIRHLQVLVDLREHGAFSSDRPQTLLEIGGGFGGLAAVIMSYNPAVTYVLLDLEETLFYQAIYLSNTFGRERVVLCDQGRPMPQLEPGRFYLVPQAQYQLIENVKFDLAINQQSMQEMNQLQVDHYCNLLERTSVLFYSANLDQHSQTVQDEKKIVAGLNAFLLGRFGPVLWDSYRDDSPILRLLRRWRTINSAIYHIKLLMSRSSAASRLYRLVRREPLRRFSDFNLQRLILRCAPIHKSS